MYTAYRDSDTIFNSKDVVSGLFEYMRKGGPTSSIEVRLGVRVWAYRATTVMQLLPVGGKGHTLRSAAFAAGVAAAEECG